MIVYINGVIGCIIGYFTLGSAGTMFNDRMWSTCIWCWLSWWAVVTSCCVADVAVVDLQAEGNDGFSVYVKGIQVIQHAPSRPFLFLGSGTTTITGLHGNFRVDDEVTERVAISDLTVTREHGGSVVLRAESPTSVTVTLTMQTNGLLGVTVEGLVAPWSRVWVRLLAQPTEHVYGAGEQYSKLDLRGATYPIWVREQGVGRNKSTLLTGVMDVLGGCGGDYHTTYFPQPSFLSSRRYFCLSTRSGYTVLDFTHAQYHELELVSTRQVELLLGGGETMQEVVELLSGVVGRQPPLPEWLATGAIIGLQGGTAKMLDVLDRAQRAGLPVAGMWIQDWSGSIHRQFGKRVYWNWQWNKQHYPDLPEVSARLRDAHGVRLLGYITPHLIDDGDLFQHAQLHGYLLRTSTNDTLLIDFMEFLCGTVDLTNPKAKDWLKGIIRTNLIDLGFGGWMADFSEYLPTDAVYMDNSLGGEMHNKFSVLWAQTNREAVEEAGKLGEVFFFMRAGFTGSQRYSTMWWAGDQNVDWSLSDGLPSTLPAALNLGLSGAGLTHHDIGGYTTFSMEATVGGATAKVHVVRTRELFFRGAELAVFTPVMRTHEGNRPDLNFQVYEDQADLQAFAVLVNMFIALSPYTKAAMMENSERGLPLQRPLFMHYEDADDNSPSWTMSYQYLYGRDLLVAPVIEPGVNEWKVYLPDDRWRYLYDGSLFRGEQWVTVPAPLGKPPVFYRDGTHWESDFKNVAEIANNGLAKQHCSSDAIDCT